jgi:uncharacterized RDD family membrane protein YckC
MTRDQHLNYCKVCKNQQFDVQQGIICSLTGRQADFELTCKNFLSDVAIEEVHYKASKVDGSLKMASAGKRFANYCIDLVCLCILYFVMGVGSAVVALIFFPEAADQLETDIGNFGMLITAVTCFSYYTILEASSGRTIGKLITGTRVVGRDGKVPGIGKIMLRTLSRFVPFEGFSFLGTMPRGWHDTWTDTHVVDVK